MPDRALMAYPDTMIVVRMDMAREFTGRLAPCLIEWPPPLAVQNRLVDRDSRHQVHSLQRLQR